MQFSVLESVTDEPHRFYPYFLIEDRNEWLIPFVNSRIESPDNYKWYPYKQYNEQTRQLENVYFYSLKEAKNFINKEKDKLPIIHYIENET